MRLARRLAAVAGMLLLTLVAAGCASALGGSLGIHGRTVVDDESGKPVGVRILSLRERSPLQGLGVNRGDVIVSVEGEAATTVDDVQRRVFAAGYERAIRIGVRSGETVREIDVVPAQAERIHRIRIRIPIFSSWDGEADTLRLGSLSLLDIGVGPDERGFTVASCLGWWSGPEWADVDLVFLGFGTGYRILPPRCCEDEKGVAVATASP
jgi:membrane-associated protease RseP (regulator of RpoE activity)